MDDLNMPFIVLKRAKGRNGGTPSPWHIATLEQFASSGDAAGWITVQKTPVDSVEYTATEVPA